ncbi:hypothetical protein VPH35_014548 [Triticum aestivum]
MEDVEWRWQSLPLLFSGAAAPAFAPSVSRRRQLSTPPFGACSRNKSSPGAWGVQAGAFSFRTEKFDRCPSCSERNVRYGVLPDRTVGSYRRPFYLSGSLVLPDPCSVAASGKSKVPVYIYVNLDDLLYSRFVLPDQKIHTRGQ